MTQIKSGKLPTGEEMRKALELRQGKELWEKFASKTVAVCGLGGLGSNIAISLARAGIGKLILMDFDTVDITNLHRQQYKAAQLGEKKTDALLANLMEIAPYVEYETHDVRITEENAKELLKDADIICEAFDNAECKAMLTNVVLGEMPDKYYVAASGMASLESPNLITTKRMTKKFYLCGDGMHDVATAGSLVAPRVMLCAAHQATTILRIAAGEYEV